MPSLFDENLCLNGQAKHILVGTRANRFSEFNASLSFCLILAFAYMLELPSTLMSMGFI